MQQKKTHSVTVVIMCFFFVFVELWHSLDRDVIRLGRTRREDNLLRFGADQRRHFLGGRRTR